MVTLSLQCQKVPLVKSNMGFLPCFHWEEKVGWEDKNIYVGVFSWEIVLGSHNDHKLEKYIF